MFLRRELICRARSLGRSMRALAIALVTLLGVLRSGARYVYCPTMDAVLASSCCERAASHDDVGSAGVEPAECCLGRRVGALPASGTAPAAGTDLADVPFTPVAPPSAVDLHAPAMLATLRFVHPARAGPRSAHERRAELMIWTC